MELVRSVCLRQIINSNWYVKNEDILEDLKMKVRDEITRFTKKQGTDSYLRYLYRSVYLHVHDKIT